MFHSSFQVFIELFRFFPVLKTYYKVICIYCYSSVSFAMQSYLPKLNVEKLLLDSAHDTYPLYNYCKRKDITPFIDLNLGNTGNYRYKDDFTIEPDGIPVCKAGIPMHHDGIEKAKHRKKFRCLRVNRKWGCYCDPPF